MNATKNQDTKPDAAGSAAPGTGSAPNPFEAGDANCDGEIDVADIIRLINYVFLEGSPPNCP